MPFAACAFWMPTRGQIALARLATGRTVAYRCGGQRGARQSKSLGERFWVDQKPSRGHRLRGRSGAQDDVGGGELPGSAG
jgi:hypothetical protein